MTLNPIKPVILLVDDDPTVRLLLQETLLQEGFSVIQACSGEQALEQLATTTPNLILLDVQMPGLDGYEVCALIRERPQGHEIPIIMVTGYDDTESIDRAFAAGAQDFIAKPISWPLLPHRVRYVLRASETAAQERRARAMSEQLLDTIPVRVYWKDKNLRYLGCNRRFAEDAGLSEPAHCRGKTVDELPWKCNASAYEYAEKELISTDGTLIGMELTHQIIGGKKLQVVCNKVTLKDASGNVIGILGTYEDITRRKEAEAQIERLAYYDSLTGLPNRALFHDRLEQAIRQAERTEYLVGLMLIDLDKFKTVNDTFGHHAGDQVLLEAAARLSRCTRKGDTVCRLGGDEFTIVIDMMTHLDSCQQIADKILSAFAAPFLVNGQNITVTASVGIAVYPIADESPETLIQYADIAMYRAKAVGRNTYRLYAPDMSASAIEHLARENALRDAILNEKFELWYQPQYDSATGEITCMEALLRWRQQDGELIPAFQFIDDIEELRLTSALTAWTLSRACHDAVEWNRSRHTACRVAVNLSTLQFHDPELVDKIQHALITSTLSPDLLELEITETCLMADREWACKLLQSLRTIGIGIALDDFGTGYSSLSYLKTLPFDTMKIDRSFVIDLPQDRGSDAITRAIMSLANSMELDVVIEGVETEGQRGYLQALGKSRLQGFLFSPAVPVDDAIALLTETELQRLAP